MNKENKEIMKVEVLGSPYMPQSIDSKMKMANILGVSGLCPSALDSVEKVFVALQYGHELGLSPMVSIQNIAVINNRPAVMTNIKKAIVFKTGKLSDYKVEEIKNKDGDIIEIIATATRTDLNINGKGTFSLKQAQKAGLMNKDNWKKYPDRMLVHRANDRLFTDLFPELLAGLLTPDEAEELPIKDVTEPLPEDTKKDSTRLKKLIDKEESLDIAVKTFNINGELIDDDETKTAQEELDEEIAKEKLDKKVEKLDKELDEVIKEKAPIIDATGQELTEDGRRVGIIHDVKKGGVTMEETGLFAKPESDFNPIDAWLDLFSNDRCRNLREFMTEKDITYFTNLARCTDKAIYTENNYKRDLEKVKKYEKELEAKGAGK